MHNTHNLAHQRFTHLKALFHQAPLPADQLKELITLAERFNKKFAAYLKSL